MNWSAPLRFGLSISKSLIHRPRGVTYGSKSYILRPCVIFGASGIRLGDGTEILRHSYLNAVQQYAGEHLQSEIVIGNNVYIGRFVYLTAMSRISIGDGCVLSEHVYITDLMHGMHPDRGPIMQQPLESKGPVMIGARCFLGYRAAVMPGVTLGEHCVVGANSVVTRSFAPYSMVAGCPARLIKTFSTKDGRWEPAID